MIKELHEDRQTKGWPPIGYTGEFVIGGNHGKWWPKRGGTHDKTKKA